MNFEERVRHALKDTIEYLEDLHKGDNQGSLDIQPILDKIDECCQKMQEKLDECCQKAQRPDSDLDDAQPRNSRDKYEQQRLFEWLRDRVDDFMYWLGDRITADNPDGTLVMPEWYKNLIYYFLDWAGDVLVDMLDDGFIFDLLPAPNELLRRYEYEKGQKALPQKMAFIHEDDPSALAYLGLNDLRALLTTCCSGMSQSMTNMSEIVSAMSGKIDQIYGSMSTVSGQMSNLTDDVGEISDDVSVIAQQMQSCESAIRRYS